MGKKPFQLPIEPIDSIRTDLLDRFTYSGNDQLITYETHEFSAVCPFSGLPDLATVQIEYIPDGYCLELKSLKLYLVSYRNVGIYQELATDRIFRDIFSFLKPRRLTITTRYATRGGIDAVCVIDSDKISV